jgi:sugar phosphate isomerase/epimerase
MRLGCCADISKAEIVKQAGFDFIECTVLSLIPEESDEVFDEQILSLFTESPLPIEAFNILLPRDLPIVGPNVDRERINKYLDKAFERIEKVGGKIVVFGSGGARSIPNGFDRKHGNEQIIEFLKLVSARAEVFNITVVIEPLNQKESNVINSIPEAFEFSRKIGNSSIQVLADFYHMEEEKEPLVNMLHAGHLLKHIHVADTGRFSPGTGIYPYPNFVGTLKKAGYNGRVSIECNWHDFEKEIGNAQQFLQEAFKE